MSKIETQELYDRLKNEKKIESNSKYANLQNKKAVFPPIENSLKVRGLRFLDSIMDSGPFLQKTVKFTGIGATIGLALSILFPPLGIAVMTVSALAGITMIGAKVAHSYINTKGGNIDNRESNETKTKILNSIVKELMEEKLSKAEIKHEGKKNGIKEDSNQSNKNHTEHSKRIVENTRKNRSGNDYKLPFNSYIKEDGTDISSKVTESAINANEYRLRMFNKPLISFNSNIKQDDVTTSKLKKQQKETQNAKENIKIRSSKL